MLTIGGEDWREVQSNRVQVRRQQRCSRAIVVNWWSVRPLKNQAPVVSMSRRLMRKIRIRPLFAALILMFLHVVGPVILSAQNSPGEPESFRQASEAMRRGDLNAAGDPPPQMREWRTEGRLVVGYIGQLIARKRVDTLIQAFHRLAVARKHLCIIGDGPQRAQLERLAGELGESDHITFFGYREDRMRLLRCFDLFVLPSELEGVPRCLMEAMGAGIPVIASDIPGCRDLVQDGVTGLLFTPGDEYGLARQIACLTQNPNLRAELARTGCQRVWETCSAEAMARGYVALYGGLVAGSARAELAKETL